MPSNSKNLDGRIAFGSFVRSSGRSSRLPYGQERLKGAFHSFALVNLGKNVNNSG